MTKERWVEILWLFERFSAINFNFTPETWFILPFYLLHLLLRKIVIFFQDGSYFLGKTISFLFKVSHERFIPHHYHFLLFHHLPSSSTFNLLFFCEFLYASYSSSSYWNIVWFLDLPTVSSPSTLFIFLIQSHFQTFKKIFLIFLKYKKKV